MEAMLITFGKRIDYRKSHSKGKKFPPDRGVVWVT